MRQAHFKATLAALLIVAFTGSARAQTGGGDVSISAVSLSPIAVRRAMSSIFTERSSITASESNTERRPPQAAPEDPAKTSAPLDQRKLKRAAGGFVAVLAVVVTGIVLGRSFAGR
jgi:membrane protein involved in colicin uptake